MDRVLLIIDDIQYSRHVEMTLRKVGFDVESVNNEFNVADGILSYNPDYIICRGTTNRLSTLNVGRKLKESNSKYNGKVILIFAEGIKISPDDLISLKMDLLLFEPLSTLKLALHLFSFSENDFEFIKDKLLKFAITDNQFRNYEQQILKNAGLTIDSEIQIVSSMDHLPSVPVSNGNEPVPMPESAVETQLVKSENENEIENESKNESKNGNVGPVDSPDEMKSSQAAQVQPAASEVPQSNNSSDVVPIFPQPADVSLETVQKINNEIQTAEQELPLRIDTYNHAISKVEQDLNISLKKRQTKKAVNKLRKDLINEQKTDKKTEQELGDEKVRFTRALFKKKS